MRSGAARGGGRGVLFSSASVAEEAPGTRFALVRKEDANLSGIDQFFLIRNFAVAFTGKGENR